MRYQGRGYRAHDPHWSFSPLSGEGAAATGGRFNRLGRPTLYLSLDVLIAVRECGQGLGDRLLPMTLVEYEVDCEDIADLRTAEAQAGEGVAFDDLSCAWLSAKLSGREPASWTVADRLQAAGRGGCVVRSFAPGATEANHNLVLWRWSGARPHRVIAHDPTGRLPRDQLSWP